MSGLETTESRNSGVGVRALTWLVKLVPAAFFLNAGVSKILGAERQIRLFDAIGWGDWFRYTTGATEIVCAILLIIPLTSGLGALGLTGLSAGALLTLVILGKPILPAVVALVWCAGLLVLQRRQVSGYMRLLAGRRDSRG